MSNRQQRRHAVAEARGRKSWTWVRLDPHAGTLLERYPAMRDIRAVYRNDFYIVQIFDVATAVGTVVHLMVRGLRGETTEEPPWRHMQRIKNELVGEALEAVQVYPRASDVVDQAHLYHLFVLPTAWPLPFGLHRENGLRA